MKPRQNFVSCCNYTSSKTVKNQIIIRSITPKPVTNSFIGDADFCVIALVHPSDELRRQEIRWRRKSRATVQGLDHWRNQEASFSNSQSHLESFTKTESV